MTDPAEPDSLRNAVALQGAAIGRHEDILQRVMEGLQSLSDHHDRTYQSLMEQFRGMSMGQSTTAGLTPAPDQGGLAASAALPVTNTAPREPNLPPPERYSGDPRTCRSFLSKCSLIFELQPSSFQSERSKVAYIVSLMSGRAGTWATAVWEQQTPICSSLAAFMAEIKKVFESPVSGREAARKLLRLRQGSRSVSDYAVDFRTLAADSSWNSDSLFDAFLNGLSDIIKDELAARELPPDLDSLVNLSMRIDSRLRDRNRERQSAPPNPPQTVSIRLSNQRDTRGSAESFRNYPRPHEVDRPEPMDLGRARISPAERERRFSSRSCLYCGTSGHYISTCPLKEQAHQ